MNDKNLKKAYKFYFSEKRKYKKLFSHDDCIEDIHRIYGKEISDIIDEDMKQTCIKRAKNRRREMRAIATSELHPNLCVEFKALKIGWNYRRLRGSRHNKLLL